MKNVKKQPKWLLLPLLLLELLLMQSAPLLLVPLLEVHPLVAGEEVLEAEEPLVIQRE
jgi:hypothetical protein